MKVTLHLTPLFTPETERAIAKPIQAKLLGLGGAIRHDLRRLQASWLLPADH